ncbi:MAG: GNAT family N-acetyltransferase [Patescibacteria group bacterium]
METKIFGDPPSYKASDGQSKKIIIRKIVKSDLKNAVKFQDYINSLIEEEAKLLMNKKAAIKEEIDFLKSKLNGIKNKTEVILVAVHNKKIVGLTDIKQGMWRRNHIGKFGISVRQGYRGIGLGNYLMSEIIKLAKTELNPKPKMIQLEVYVNNKPAIALYKKMGFKQVAKLPKQIQHKGKLIDELVMIKFL